MITKKKKISTEAKANNQTYSNIPFDLTLLVLRRLSLRDNIRASSVCKTWQEACVSIRVDQEGTTPWLLRFPFGKEEFELYDPSLDKTHICKLSPELRGSHIDCSTDGWLLMHNRNLTEPFFFNPFTRERIGLPWPNLWRTRALGFSCAPTSNSHCVIFSLSEDTKNNVVTIKTYCLATKVCTTFTFSNRLPFRFGGFEHVVFSNGVFYCLTNKGWLGMFNLSTNHWNLFLPRRASKYIRAKYRYMTAYQGDIFLIYTDGLDEPRYLKLDLTNRKWKDEKRPEGLMFYLSFRSTLTSTRDLVHTRKMHQCNWCNVWLKPSLNASYLFTS